MMSYEEKIELIQLFREDLKTSPVTARANYEIVLQALTLDVLDGGVRFEDLYDRVQPHA